MTRHHRPRGQCVKGVVVTDHALVRWLERVHGIDMKDVAREIVTNDRAHQIKQHPFTSLDIPQMDIIVIVRDGRAVSVVPRGKKGAA